MKKHKPHVYRARMLSLADVLTKVKRTKFDFGTWIGINRGDIHGVDDYSSKAKRLTTASFNECNTVGCALGWGCTMPKFKRLGLSIKRGAVHLAGTRPRSGRKGTRAAEVLFGLSSNEAQYCFIPDGYLNDDLPYSPSMSATPKEVAEHLRAFASWKWPDAEERKANKKDKATAAFFAANPGMPR